MAQLVSSATGHPVDYSRSGALQSAWAASMKVLFVLKHPASVRNFEAALHMLTGRGHRIHLAFEQLDVASYSALVESVCERSAGAVTAGRCPSRADDYWGPLAARLRSSVDYLRYLEPRYAQANQLRERAAQQAPAAVRRVSRLPLARSTTGVRILKNMLSGLERNVPPPASVDRFLTEFGPDVVLVTPLVGIASRQADYVRAQRG